MSQDLGITSSRAPNYLEDSGLGVNYLYLGVLLVGSSEFNFLGFLV